MKQSNTKKEKKNTEKLNKQNFKPTKEIQTKQKSPRQQKGPKMKREQAETLCHCNQVYDGRVSEVSPANGNAGLVEHIKKLQVLPTIA